MSLGGNCALGGFFTSLLISRGMRYFGFNGDLLGASLAAANSADMTDRHAARTETERMMNDIIVCTSSKMAQLVLRMLVSQMSCLKHNCDVLSISG